MWIRKKVNIAEYYLNEDFSNFPSWLEAIQLAEKSDRGSSLQLLLKFSSSCKFKKGNNTEAIVVLSCVFGGIRIKNLIGFHSV